MSSIKTAIIEDEELVRESLSGLLQEHPLFDLVSSFSSVENFLDDYTTDQIDVLLLDINLGGGMSGLKGLRHIKNKVPKIEIIMLTTYDDSDRIFKALCGGATAYLTKRTPFKKITEAITIVSRGGSYMSPNIARKVTEYFLPKKHRETNLTPRQSQVVDAIVDGLSYKMIADRLSISVETVRDHIKKIYKKLEVNSKSELVRKKMEGRIDF